ncbi:MAG TPA: hypothetical protein VGH87_18870 [Polyangiaceae bacterium]
MVERELEDSERAAIEALATKVRVRLKIRESATPDEVIAAIGKFFDAVRAKRKAAPRDDDTRLGLGALWGEQLRAKAKWTWVHLTYPTGFKSFALVPKDRHCACFPLNDIPDQMSVRKKPDHTTILLFNMCVAKNTPETKAKSYTPFG